MKRIAAALRAANPDAKPRHFAVTGTGLWLRWQTPDGDTELLGVTCVLSGNTSYRLATPEDIRQAATQRWDAATAQQLCALLDATARAIHTAAPLPAGIHAEPIPIVNGDTPSQVLDTLWRAGPAQTPLLQSKTNQQS